MKILHTSDWHFGMPVGTGSYEACQRHFLSQLREVILRENVGAVLLAGDVYDAGIVSADAIRIYNDAATMLCMELGVQLIVIAGNHDSAARLSACRELLAAAGLHVNGRLTRDVEPVLLDGGKVAVYPLPFFTRDAAEALFPEKKSEIRSTETAYMAVCDHIRETMDPARRNIVMAHAMVVGAELSDSDRSARVGMAAAVSKDVFAGFDYVALGHIHKPQVVAPHVRYSGSPLKYSFGSEEAQEKGVVLIDTEDMSQRFIPLPPLRDRASAEGTLDELMAREDLQDQYLKLTVTDRYAGLDLLAQLRERFPNVLEVYGKHLEDQESATALSVEELECMDETDIMKKFMAENFGCEPTAAQLSLFADVLAWSEEEGELS